MFIITVIIFCSLFVSRYSCCIPTQQLEFEEIVTTILILETTTSTSTTTTTTTAITTTTILVPKCLVGWIMLDRETYYWCMKIYWGPSTGETADADCRTLNSAAVSSGFQDKQELVTMMTQALSEDAVPRRLYLGLKRTTACWTYKITSTCTALTSFYWTDGHTTGSDGIEWAPNRPDNHLLLQPYVWINTVKRWMDDSNAGIPQAGAVCGMEADYYSV